MARIDEIKILFDVLCKTSLSNEDEIPELSSSEKDRIVKLIDDAKAEAERLHILDIMNKVCR